MIVDSLESFAHYFQGIAGMDEFIASLDDNIAEGRHEMDGDNVFAMVSNYECRPRTKCSPETHEQYVDIQIVVKGQEIIEWFPREVLNIKDPYDPEKDLAFYERPEAEGTQVILKKGVFAVFFPHDAHMPQVCSGNDANVTKVVVKIRTELI